MPRVLHQWCSLMLVPVCLIIQYMQVTRTKMKNGTGIDNRGGRRDWKRMLKVWGYDGTCSSQHAPFAMIILTVQLGPYMVSSGLIARLNQVWGGKPKTEM